MCVYWRLTGGREGVNTGVHTYWYTCAIVIGVPTETGKMKIRFVMEKLLDLKEFQKSRHVMMS